jgi:uncharacterized membrane protein AbrB (regulator of aidB expression)
LPLFSLQISGDCPQPNRIGPPMIPSPHQKWSNYAFGLAGICLAAIALSTLFRFSTPALTGTLMIGIVISGTAAWILQARQKCPHCGELFGYGIRLGKTDRCQKCGGKYSG